MEKLKLIYPKEASITEIYTTPALEVWYPTYPEMLTKRIVYTFYDLNGNIFYTGKTMSGRQRFRWHIRNTFKRHTKLHDLWLDACTVWLEPKPNNDWDNYTLEYYEAMLIRQFRPMYNHNIKVTYLRSLENLT